MSTKKEWTQEQIIKVLDEAERSKEKIAELARRHGISEWTFYRWRKKYAGMSVPEATRLKELERENVRLKKLVVDRDLEIEVMKEIAAKKW